MKRVTVDSVTDDPTKDEFVVYLVENGPWIPIEERLRTLQERLYDSFEMIVDGHLVAKFPQSKTRKIRVQLDSYDSPPRELIEFVEKFSNHIKNDPEMQRSISESGCILSLRLINGSQIE